MKRYVLIGMLLLGVMIFSCGTNKQAIGDTSWTSVDWSGVYLFTDNNYKVPEIQLTLNENGTYKLVASAIGEDTKNTYSDGKFEWDKQGRTIRLDKQIPHLSSDHLVVGENILFVLKGKDSENHPLGELLQFQKQQTDSNLTEKYWKLISINGRTVTKDDFMSKEPHIIFKSEFNHINGNDGCNGFGGIYKLEGKTISFDKLFSTMMACPDSFVFNEFMRILQKEATYTITEESLTLQTAKDVMKFEVVYL